MNNVTTQEGIRTPKYPSLAIKVDSNSPGYPAHRENGEIIAVLKDAEGNVIDIDINEVEIKFDAYAGYVKANFTVFLSKITMLED